MSENEAKPKQRQVEIAVEIAAKPADVWRGITEAEEIQKWFSPVARVEPGAGGSIFVSWGPGCEGTAQIEVWEPEKHLRTIAPASDGTIAELRKAGVEASPMIVDYHLEAHEGSTTLRLVQSGFGEQAEWDGEYEGTRVGWAVFLHMLRHLLVHHPGEGTQGVMHVIPLSISRAEAWQKLTAGLSGPRPDGGYVLDWDGQRLQGTVECLWPDEIFIGTVPADNWALFGFNLTPRKAGGCMLNWGASLFGRSAEEAQAYQERWATFLNREFGK